MAMSTPNDQTVVSNYNFPLKETSAPWEITYTSPGAGMAQEILRHLDMPENKEVIQDYWNNF